MVFFCGERERKENKYRVHKERGGRGGGLIAG